MRAGITAEDDKRRKIKDDQQEEVEATKRRLEKNQQDFELQRKMAQDLLSKD